MRRFVALVFCVFAVVICAACGSDATGIDECRQIENARCEAAAACPAINLNVPPYATNGVDGCKAFYQDACLHGLEVGDPGAPAVAACVGAIKNAVTAKPPNCVVVQFPFTTSECSWLTPAAVVDASVDAFTDVDGASPVDAADSATD